MCQQARRSGGAASQGCCWQGYSATWHGGGGRRRRRGIRPLPSGCQSAPLASPILSLPELPTRTVGGAGIGGEAALGRDPRPGRCVTAGPVDLPAGRSASRATKPGPLRLPAIPHLVHTPEHSTARPAPFTSGPTHTGSPSPLLALPSIPRCVIWACDNILPLRLPVVVPAHRGQVSLRGRAPCHAASPASASTLPAVAQHGSHDAAPRRAPGALSAGSGSGRRRRHQLRRW